MWLRRLTDTRPGGTARPLWPPRDERAYEAAGRTLRRTKQAGRADRHFCAPPCVEAGRSRPRAALCIHRGRSAARLTLALGAASVVERHMPAAPLPPAL